MKSVRPFIRKFFFWFKLTMTLTSSSLIATAEGSAVESEFTLFAYIEDAVIFVID